SRWPAVSALRGTRVRRGLVARLGGAGHASARRARGDREELRAHPPQQPRDDGRAALPVQGRYRRVFAEAGRERVVRPHRPRDGTDAAAGRAADHPPCERVDERGGGDAADRYADRGGVLPPRWDPALRAAADPRDGVSRAAYEPARHATRVQRPPSGATMKRVLGLGAAVLSGTLPPSSPTAAARD